MKLFLLDTLLREAPENGISKDSKKIYLLDAAEFSKTAEGMPHKKKVLQDLSVVHYCKAKLYGSCILGILVWHEFSQYAGAEFRIWLSDCVYTQPCDRNH